MEEEQRVNEQVAALADHLFERRNAILENWRCAVEEDPALAAASILGRKDFYDHIPAVPDAFEAILRARSPGIPSRNRRGANSARRGARTASLAPRLQPAGRHARVGPLASLLGQRAGELWGIAREIEAGVMPAARRALARLCSDGVTESAARYAELQQLEATGRIRDLEQAVENLRLLDQRRGDTWRGAVHDLHGRFGVIKNISDLLSEEETDASLKAEFLSLLQKSVGSLHTSSIISWSYPGSKRGRSAAICSRWMPPPCSMSCANLFSGR